ncbi:uncharacterized protein LOC122244658 isoform X1 [Penaeus japonicus]|uniref:uncharacterized protein LOC122244658 isoform X1 n=1 Tax=Penaeus japonicus TaxID=27405 RepID=UPI001C71165D|nr:uncharacterized protein LOC122244658 isoform X1 [Penaeus japonicus]
MIVESSRLRLLLATGLLVAAVALVSTLGPGLLTTPNRLRDLAPLRVLDELPTASPVRAEPREAGGDERERPLAVEAEPRPSREGVTYPPASPPQQCPTCPSLPSSHQCPTCPPPPPPHQCPQCPEPEALQVDFRRRIARTIADVQLLISRVAGTVATVDAEWALRLGAVAAELDPRLASPPNVPRRRSARLPGLEAPWPTREGDHVCPEAYFGPKFDQPFNQRGMEPEACQGVPPFASVLTALLPAQTWPRELAVFVVEKIRKLYGIPVIVITSDASLAGQLGSGVRVSVPLAEQSLADALNTVVDTVETPFVFLGESLAHFSNQSSLERLVRVLDDLDHVQVAGGAARDTRGRWIHGCLQQHMANYHAKYTLGYYHSKYECMYCDDLLTPFATRTKLLRTIPFSAGLSGQAVYRDWFAKVRSAGHLAVTCPDVMFFLSGHVNMTAEDWLPMARRWALERVQAFDGQEHNFSCESVGISCKSPLGIIKSFLLPPCCRRLMEHYLTHILDYGEARGLPHELQAGSALGALKMGSYLPWDYDMDVVFECKDFKEWMGIGALLKSRGSKCRASITQRNKYITIYCPNFFLELFCHRHNYTSSIYLPEELRDTPTTIWYAKRWVRAMSNPGLYSRNKLGLDDLKHAGHWRTLKVTSVGKQKGGYDNPGAWRRCSTPTHHSCLDHFPADGNLPFLYPFLQL